jgi:hypothetical protein
MRLRLAALAGIATLVSLNACSSGGQPTEGVSEAAPPGEVQEECIDSGTGEGPMDNN